MTGYECQVAYVILFAPGIAFLVPPKRHSMKILLAAILLTVLMPLQSLHAAPLNLYLGAVLVADQSPGEQARAMPLALAQVLQKLSGLRDFDEFPGLEPALQDARSLAITFYYRHQDITLPDGGKGEELRLLADFSPPAVDSLMQSLQLPKWKPERRPLTIWPLVDDGVSRSIMPIEFEYAWERMVDVADARGMPVIRPQPDAEGVYPVDAQLLWGGYTDDLVALGPVDALIVAARREGPEWNVRMNLDYMGKTWSWRNRDIDLQNALTQGMHQAIDEIAAVDSIAAADQGKWSFEMTVSGLATAGDYARCLSYLQGLSLIDHVRVSSAGPGKVHFVLSLNALPDYLVRALAADSILAASASEGEYILLP